MQVRDSDNVKKLLILFAVFIAAGFLSAIFFPDYSTRIAGGLFGTAMVLISFILEKGDINKIENCTYVTNGVITDYYVKTDIEEPDSYFPIYEYSYGGQKYTQRSNMSCNPSRMPKGMEVDIFLNPDSPEESYIAETRKSSKTFTLLFRLFGIATVLLCLLVHDNHQ